MCGIVGIVGNQNVAAQLYDGLTVLQHRGQDAAGIATADGTRLRLHKGNGLVRDVFNARVMSPLEGASASPIAATRPPVRKAWTRRSRSTSTRRTASRWRTTAT
jgi:glutamine phosphoribosylpyrophosphate amidotransferase